MLTFHQYFCFITGIADPEPNDLKTQLKRDSVLLFLQDIREATVTAFADRNFKKMVCIH